MFLGSKPFLFCAEEGSLSYFILVNVIMSSTIMLIIVLGEIIVPPKSYVDASMLGRFIKITSYMLDYSDSDPSQC